jgi:hypothetical protein
MKIRAFLLGWGIQNEDVASLDGPFNPRDEENTVFPGMGEKAFMGGHPVMIGDGNNVKAFLGGFGDELFSRIANVIEGIFRCVQVQVSLKRFCSLSFHNGSLAGNILSLF